MDARTTQSPLNFAEGVGPGLQGLESTAVFEQLERQYTDLLAAMQWFITEGRTDESLRLATSLVPFWMATKRLDEGSAWFDRALALPSGNDAHRGRASFDAGYLAFWKGDDECFVVTPESCPPAQPSDEQSHRHSLGWFGADRPARGGQRKIKRS